MRLNNKFLNKFYKYLNSNQKKALQNKMIISNYNNKIAKC